MSPLAALTSLQVLDVTGTPVSDVRPLGGLGALEWLDLTRTQVRDIAPLEGLNELRWLSLRETRVSERAVQRLRRMLEGCVIDFGVRTGI